MPGAMPYLAAMPRGKRPDPSHLLVNVQRRHLFLSAALSHPHPDNKYIIQYLIKNLPSHVLASHIPIFTQLGYGPQAEAELTRRSQQGMPLYPSQDHRRNYFHQRYLEKKAQKLGIPVEDLIRQEEQQAALQSAEAPASPKPKKLYSLKQFANFKEDLKTLQKHQLLAARALCHTALQNMENGISFKEDHILESVPEALLLLNTLAPQEAASIYPRLRPRLHSYNVYQQRLNRHLKPQAQPYKMPESSPMLLGE